jgi:menaquinone-dependent protoporphyrinogen oxidase
MKVLVTAASKHGTAREIADVIAGVLDEAGLEVTVAEPALVTGLEEFDAVVLGSGVYAGHWLEAAKRFAEANEAALTQCRVWLFSCGPLGDPPKPAGDPVDVAPILAATGAVDHRVFPGRLVKSELSFAEKLIVKGVRAPYGDFRPWDEITAWAREIARALVGERVSEPVAAS